VTRQRAYVPLILVPALSSAAPVHVHHEAMFGPQSAAVLSPGIFLAAQVFDKETGKDDQQRRETTVYSVGFKPIKTQPMSIAFVLAVDSQAQRNVERRVRFRTRPLRPAE
jgi:hypothetical protein